MDWGSSGRNKEISRVGPKNIEKKQLRSAKEEEMIVNDEAGK